MDHWSTFASYFRRKLPYLSTLAGERKFLKIANYEILRNFARPKDSSTNIRHPIKREPDFETWRLVNHATFDGKLEDNFAATSLHLKLTGFERPLTTALDGGYDKEVIYIEAVVSAHDRGEWVADLDILKFASDREDEKIELCVCLPSTCDHDVNERADYSVFRRLISIDNWYEFLDRPRNMAIIRACRNEAARLALASTLMAETTLLIGFQDICWACVKDWESFFRKVESVQATHSMLSCKVHQLGYRS